MTIFDSLKGRFPALKSRAEKERDEDIASEFTSDYAPATRRACAFAWALIVSAGALWFSR